MACARLVDSESPASAGLADAAALVVDESAVSTVGAVAASAHTTSDGLTLVPTIYPSWEEFANFDHLIKRLEGEGAAEHGLVKIVPPPDWPWFKDPRFWHIASENDTPTELARELGVPLKLLLSLNRPTFPGLGPKSKLQGGTIIQLPREREPHTPPQAKRTRKRKSGSKNAPSSEPCSKTATVASTMQESSHTPHEDAEHREALAASVLSSELLASTIKPIKQCMSRGGTPGTYELQMLERPRTTVAEFQRRAGERFPPHDEAISLATKNPPYFATRTWPQGGLRIGDVAEAEADAMAIAPVERIFWRSLGGAAALKDPPEYGADQAGLSVFGKSPLSAALAGSWDMNRLPCLLTHGLGDDTELPGVTTPMLYIGMWRALFGWHTEDMELNSINFLHHGAPKLWYVVPPASASRFEIFAAGAFPELAGTCRSFLRHKNVLISPSRLSAAGIPVLRAIQRPGEFMITFPRAYHAGFNSGFNLAESVNFATARWPTFGKSARPCGCEKHSVRIDVDAVVANVQAKAPSLLQCTPMEMLGAKIFVRWIDEASEHAAKQQKIANERKGQEASAPSRVDESGANLAECATTNDSLSAWYRCIVCRPRADTEAIFSNYGAGTLLDMKISVCSADGRFEGVFDFDPSIDEWKWYRKG